MGLPQSNTQAQVYSYTRTELLSLRTKTSLLSLSTVDSLRDLDIGYHLPRRHRSSRGVKRKKQNLHSLIVASFNAQSVKGNDMACRRCEISTFIRDNGVDLFFVTETWLSAQVDEAKTAELIIIIIMVIFKCYFSGEHIAPSLKNNNGVNMELGKTNRLKALCIMQINA